MGWGSNPGGGSIFSMPVQTSPKDHPALCTVGTRSFQWVTVKQLGHGADHPLPPLALRLQMGWSNTSTSPCPWADMLWGEHYL